MKTTIPFLFFITILLPYRSFSQIADTVDWQNVEFRYDSIAESKYPFNRPNKLEFLFKIGSKTPFTGVKVSYFENGQLKFADNYKDGLEDGLSTWWFSNGNKDREYTFNKGLYEGRWTRWHENGQKSSEGYLSMTEGVNGYIGHKDDGPFNSWYENGNPESSGKYSKGIKEGLWTEWHDNGKKKSEGNYSEDKKEGLWIEWDENGKKILSGNYKEGLRDGNFIELGGDGTSYELEYKDDQLKMSSFIFLIVKGIFLTDMTFPILLLFLLLLVILYKKTSQEQRKKIVKIFQAGCIIPLVLILFILIVFILSSYPSNSGSELSLPFFLIVVAGLITIIGFIWLIWFVFVLWWFLRKKNSIKTIADTKN